MLIDARQSSFRSDPSVPRANQNLVHIVAKLLGSRSGYDDVPGLLSEWVKVPVVTLTLSALAESNPSPRSEPPREIRLQG